MDFESLNGPGKPETTPHFEPGLPDRSVSTNGHRRAEAPDGESYGIQADPSAIFRKLCTINGPFEAAWMAAFNQETWLSDETWKNDATGWSFEKGRRIQVTQKEKEARAFRRRLIRYLVATEDVFGDRIVDKDGFAEMEREKLNRKRRKAEEANGERKQR